MKTLLTLSLIVAGCAGFACVSAQADDMMHHHHHHMHHHHRMHHHMHHHSMSPAQKPAAENPAPAQ